MCHCQDTYRRRQMQRTITRQMSFDLTKLLVTEDWFSDISPQTMRRLLNIVSVTGKHCTCSPVTWRPIPAFFGWILLFYLFQALYSECWTRKWTPAEDNLYSAETSEIEYYLYGTNWKTSGIRGSIRCMVFNIENILTLFDMQIYYGKYVLEDLTKWWMVVHCTER